WLYGVMIIFAQKPFYKKLVCKAVSYFFGAAAIVQILFCCFAYPGDGRAGIDLIGVLPKVKRCSYDRWRGRGIVSQAHCPQACEVRLYYSAGKYPKDREVCQVVAAQMVKGGFRVELISQEYALHWGPEGVNGGKLAFYYENRGSLTDADTIYDQYFRTGTTKR